MPRDIFPPKTSSSSDPTADDETTEELTPSTSIVASPESTSSIPTPTPSNTNDDPHLFLLERSGSRDDSTSSDEDGSDLTSALLRPSLPAADEEADDISSGTWAATTATRRNQQQSRFLRDARTRIGAGFGQGGKWSIAGRSQRDELHPYVSALSVRDVESCLRLEEQVFGEAEREDREKFLYRLTKCPELSIGLFSSSNSTTNIDLTSLPTYPSALPADSFAPDSKAVLLGMIIATKTNTPVATDEAMQVPQNWTTVSPSKTDERGHIDNGRTVTIWSLAVLPTYQRYGLGKTLLRSYQQRISSSGIADRIALLAREDLVGWYEGMGFENRGKSKAKFAGGEWWDLVYEFPDLPAPSVG